MGRRITILGMGPSAYRKADNIADYCKGTEIWSLNNAYLMYENLFHEKSFARFFELHSWQYLQDWHPGDYQGKRIDHFKTLMQLQCPVYVSEFVPVVSNQVLYPHVEVLEHFGTTAEFKGSPSYMLALALYEHAMGDKIDYIQSYGIDTSDEKHKCQRASWAQWTLRAELMGIEIGGSMLNFRNDPEEDEGLNGLNELIKSKITDKQKEESESEATNVIRIN
jgi:hypothetical protein